MKYLKTNEALFSKDKKIPQYLIDDVKTSLESKYKVTMSRESNISIGVYDKVTFSIDTPIGLVNSILTLRSTSKNKIFNSYILHYNTAFNNKGYSGYDITLSNTGKGRSIIGQSALSDVEYVIDKVSKKKDAQNKYDDFYKKVSVDDISDTLLDLSDLIGKYKIEKYTYSDQVVSKKGYTILFSHNFDFLSKGDYDIRYKMTDQYSEILEELRTIYKRVDDLYDLDLTYSFSAPEFTSLGRLLIILLEK